MILLSCACNKMMAYFNKKEYKTTINFVVNVDLRATFTATHIIVAMFYES